MPDDRTWAEKKAQEILAKRQREDLERRTFLEAQALIGTKMPDMWAEVKNALRSKIEALNKALGDSLLDYAQADNDVVTIRLKNMTDDVSVRFNREKRSIAANTINTEFDWDGKVVTGYVYFVSKQVENKPMTPNEVATHILNDVSKFL
jgi:hypothetical protein